MKLSDIIVGEDYAIRWGGGRPIRGTVTYAGRDRVYTVTEGRAGVFSRKGPRVFFQAPGVRYEQDTSAGQVLRPWAEQEALNAAESSVEAEHAARLESLQEQLTGVPVGWDYNWGSSRESRTQVVVPIAGLEAVLAAAQSVARRLWMGWAPDEDAPMWHRADGTRYAMTEDEAAYVRTLRQEGD